MIAENYDIILPYYVLILSAIAFVVTVADKLLSKTDKRRVPEKRFIMFSVFGGGLGVLSAFYLVRHKTKHNGLLTAVWVSTVICYIVLVAVSFFLK